MKSRWLIFLFFTYSLTSMPVMAEPASKESVKTMMNRTGVGDMGKQMASRLLPHIKQQIPDASENFWADVRAEMDTDNLVEMVIPVYQKYLTEKDAKEINAFYNTEAGNKLISIQPDIIKESTAIVKKWGQDTARIVMDKYKAQSAK